MADASRGDLMYLAQNDNLQVHEEKSKGVYVKNLSDYYVSSAQEVYEIMRQGGAARVVTSTSALFFLPPLYRMLTFHRHGVYASCAQI